MIGDYDPDVRTSVIQAVEALVRHGELSHELVFLQGSEKTAPYKVIYMRCSQHQKSPIYS